MEDMRNYVQLGDRITYRSDNGVEGTMIVNSINFLPKPEDAKIIEIERPVYEVVKKVEVEEEKYILIYQERWYLKYILTQMFTMTGYDAKSFIINKDDPNDITIEFYANNGGNIANVKSRTLFEKLDNNVSYDIYDKRLGLYDEDLDEED